MRLFIAITTTVGFLCGIGTALLCGEVIPPSRLCGAAFATLAVALAWESFLRGDK